MDVQAGCVQERLTVPTICEHHVDLVKHDPVELSFIEQFVDVAVTKGVSETSEDSSLVHTLTYGTQDSANTRQGR